MPMQSLYDPHSKVSNSYIFKFEKSLFFGNFGIMHHQKVTGFGRNYLKMYLHIHTFHLSIKPSLYHSPSKRSNPYKQAMTDRIWSQGSKLTRPRGHWSPDFPNGPPFFPKFSNPLHIFTWSGPRTLVWAPRFWGRGTEGPPREYRVSSPVVNFKYFLVYPTSYTISF